MPSKRMVPEQELSELSDEMVRLAAAKDAEIARLTELLNIVRLTDHPAYELGYQEGGSSVNADIICAFDEVLDLDVEGAWDAAEKAGAEIARLTEQRDRAIADRNETRDRTYETIRQLREQRDRAMKVVEAARAYREAETDGTPRMYRGKVLQDLADVLDDTLAALDAEAAAETAPSLPETP